MNRETPDSGDLSELDQAILHTLQLAPRASWTKVARVLSIDATTVARRWRQLHEAGTAWVTCHPALEPGTQFALVEIECEHGRLAEVTRAVCAEPWCITVDVASGARDLLVVAAARTYEELAGRVIEGFQSIAHIRAVRSHFALRRFTDGSRWRLSTLDSSQVGQVRRGAGDRLSGPWSELSDEDWAMALELGRDGRASVPRLAQVCGTNETWTRRRLEQLLGNGQITLRTEVARSASRFPVQAHFFADAAIGQLDHRVALLARHPEIRSVFSSVDAYTLGFAVWVNSLEHLLRFEKQITQALGLLIRDRILVLRSAKRVGRLLDVRGRSLTHVPADLRG
ncbi:Lrp/AsnC family transcriptional regulator [Streptomyces sp. NPDC051555]|uniref:Lrp/AsnC family transcriptional regulator n=1 Tax=Streptomyces sp. NPDC051555 TaxID=3365657 RepID=UPI0037A29ECF